MYYFKIAFQDEETEYRQLIIELILEANKHTQN
jgi:hypothetical protein